MSFFSINQMVHQSGHSLQRWEFLPLRVFVSLCLSKKIPLYSHMWAKDVKAALQMSAFIRFSALTRKKSLRPISFVKGLLQDETCPRPGLFFFFFFVPRTHELMLPGCLPGPGGGGAAGIHQVHYITTSQSAAEMLTWRMLRWWNIYFYMFLLWLPVC